MDSKLQDVLKYFAQFDYKPSFEEVYTYFPSKISKKSLKVLVNKTKKNTLGEYRNMLKKQKLNVKTSIAKIQKIHKFIELISAFPQIGLVGLSGSVSMLNAQDHDDIDLFIISVEKRIWTARFLCNVSAWLLGLKRSRKARLASNKVCLNLFFSQSTMQIEKKRRSAYMAHEALQMVPIMDVNHTYRSFLVANDWILNFFPNVLLDLYFPYQMKYIQSISKIRRNFSAGIIGDVLEKVLKLIQLSYMSKPSGEERISHGQLWFHPRDYSRIVGK